MDERLVSKWDHAALFRYDDPLVLAVQQAQPDAPERVITLPENPTNKVMAKTAFQEIAKVLPEGLTLFEVTLWETPNSSACVSLGDLQEPHPPC